MFVVIFRATIRNLDSEYSKVAARLRELALNEFGCLEFHAVSEGGNEVALSYWPSEENILAWKSHPEHVRAQSLGKERWYQSYSVQVATISREYGAGT
jgi:heme-degrading monooxygenase HmoA